MSNDVRGAEVDHDIVASRRGFDHRAGVGRARPKNTRGDLDHDPSMMVQEQIARLNWFAAQNNLAGTDVLDLGCGTGFNCGYVLDKYGAKSATGVDIAESAIAFARKAYGNARFEVGDVCDRNLDPGQHPVALCCEVIEHVPDPDALLANISRLLAPDGVALISTPNKPVFSLDHEPSPVNHTHLKEFTLREFHSMLQRHFGSVTIAGQRFNNARLFNMQQDVVRRNIQDLKVLGSYYWNIPLRRIWKVARMEPLRRLLGGGLRYGHRDFDFVNPVGPDSIWLCAIVRH